MSVSRESAVKFARLRAEHIPNVLEIEHEAYPDPWKQGMFRQELTNASSYFCVAFREEELAGYGGFWLLIDEAHITKVTVARDFRGQGIGLQLMEHLLREAETRGANAARLEVREKNMRARQLYEGLGFDVVGARKGYYALTNETAIVMVKSLRGA